MGYLAVWNRDKIVEFFKGSGFRAAKLPVEDPSSIPNSSVAATATGSVLPPPVVVNSLVAAASDIGTSGQALSTTLSAQSLTSVQQLRQLEIDIQSTQSEKKEIEFSL